MALAVILLLSRLILNASNAQTLPGWNVGCRADTVRVEQDSAFGFLCHWSRADVGQSSAIPYFQPPPPPSRWPNHRRAAMVSAALLEGAASAGLLAMAGCRARRSDALPDRSGGGRRLLERRITGPCPRSLEAEAAMLACAGKHPAKLGPTRDRDDFDRDHGWGAIPDDAEAITPMPEAITPPSDESPTRGARPSP